MHLWGVCSAPPHSLPPWWCCIIRTISLQNLLTLAISWPMRLLHFLFMAVQIRVFCRVRPHPYSVVRCQAGSSTLTLTADGKEHAFNFDKVFPPSCSQVRIRHVPPEVATMREGLLRNHHSCEGIAQVAGTPCTDAMAIPLPQSSHPCRIHLPADLRACLCLTCTGPCLIMSLPCTGPYA